MSKIIGTQIIGNSLYIIKKRGLLDVIKDIFTLRIGYKSGRINIEKPDFKPIRSTCGIHHAGGYKSNRCFAMRRR